MEQVKKIAYNCYIRNNDGNLVFRVMRRNDIRNGHYKFKTNVEDIPSEFFFFKKNEDIIFQILEYKEILKEPIEKFKKTKLYKKALYDLQLVLNSFAEFNLKPVNEKRLSMIKHSIHEEEVIRIIYGDVQKSELKEIDEKYQEKINLYIKLWKKFKANPTNNIGIKEESYKRILKGFVPFQFLLQNYKETI